MNIPVQVDDVWISIPTPTVVGRDGSSIYHYDTTSHKAYLLDPRTFQRVKEIPSHEFYQFKVKKASSRGEYIHTELNLTFHEAVEGCGKTIHYNRMIGCEDCSGSGAFSPDSFRRCFTCGGRGFVFHKSAKHGSEVLCDKCDGKGKIIYESCEPCGGSGQVTIREHEYITVPIGVRGDQKLRLEGKGWNWLN